jgi:aquaporin Z
MTLSRRLGAEFIGTFWLVLGGCGSAVLAATFPDVGIGLLGVSLAFGLTVLTMAYAFGHISGGHFNPAVTVGLWLGRRTPGRDVLPYIITQVAAAIAASGVLWVIAAGRAGFSASTSGFAANGYGEHSPGGYTLGSAAVAELVMTAAFLMVILGSTDRRAPKNMGPLAIGLCLTLIHLVIIPVTNTSVNPARSTGPALFVGGWAIGQLWLFWLAPLIGGAVAGISYRFVVGDDGTEEIAEEAQDTASAETSAGDLPHHEGFVSGRERRRVEY